MSIQLPPRPRAPDLWQQAIITQTEAMRQMRFATAHPERLGKLDFMLQSFRNDSVVLPQSEPFAWSGEVTEAVHQASHNVPGDTKLSFWNLPTAAVWWHFEVPLPLTVAIAKRGVQAISLAWVKKPSDEDSIFRIGCWGVGFKDMIIIPSHIFFWRQGESLDEMLARTWGELEHQFGPEGQFAHVTEVEHIPVDDITEAIVWLARFILAGLAWLDQKIILASDQKVEDHRVVARKFRQHAQRDLEAVKVVHLRRVQHKRQTPHDVEFGEEFYDEPSRTYHCRWVVDGHWRNAAVGPGRTEHRLTWVHPYVKGPEDMPMRVPKGKVYLVDR